MSLEGTATSQTSLPVSSYHNTGRRFLGKIALSSLVSFVALPLFYATNMLMMGKTFMLRGCLRGSGWQALNTGISTFITITIDDLAKRLFQKKNPGEPLSISQKLMAGVIAGACSGIAITPGSMGILNSQINGKKIAIRFFAEAIKRGKIGKLFTSVECVMMRETSYAFAYLFQEDIVTRLVAGFFRSEENNVAAGAFLAGAGAGFLGTIGELPRVQKQSDALKGKQVRSYPQIARQLSSRASLERLSPVIILRMLSVALSVLVLKEGQRHLFPDLADVE